MKKITAYVWTFCLLLVVFFTVGMFTLGNTKTTGKSMEVEAEKSVYYATEDGDSVTVKAVYVNIGGIHTELGADSTVTVKTTTSTTSAISASWSTLESVQVGNVTSQEGVSGALYNWIAVATEKSKASVRKIQFQSSVDLELNEIVVIDSTNKLVSLVPYTAGTGYDEADVSASLDAQEAFSRFFTEDGAVILDNSAYENLTQEEGYYMSSVRNVMSGTALFKNGSYVLDGNFNYLASVLFVPSVALFGVSAFALRLPAFIATCLLIAFAFLLIRELTKSDLCAFWFGAALMLGGMVTTVGRLGAPYVMVASALVASAYFTYRFFARGIGKDFLKGGMNVLISGVFAAFAMAMDITAVIPVVGILVLFGFGLRRQKLARKVALEKLEGRTSEISEEASAVGVFGSDAQRINANYDTKDRVAYGFAALGFVMATLVLMLLAATLCYSAYIRAHSNTEANFLAMLWEGIAGSARDNGVTAYTAANASILSWLIPYKPATLYTGIASVANDTYLGWHVLVNGAAQLASAAAFLGSTVKFIWDFAQKRNDKKTLRFRRTYIVLAGGMLAAVCAALLRGNASAISGMLFHVCYLGFLPLAASLLPEGKTTTDKALINVAFLAVIAVFALTFALGLPATYGYTVTASRARLFTWMRFASNGIF